MVKKISEFMREEHRELDTLWASFASEKNKEHALINFEKFKEKLLMHMKIEDTQLSPIFNKYLGIQQGQATVISEDHTTLLSLLEKVESGLTSNNASEFSYNQKHFRRLIIKHQDKEILTHYVLFDKIIPQKDWEEILNQL